MQKNTNRLLDLSNQLLDFRKTEMEHMKLTFVKCDVRNLLNDLIIRFKPIIEEQVTTLTVDLPNEEFFAYVDIEALKKILSNLINNAIKYSKNKISLTLSSHDEHFIISIKNDGEIIPTHLSKKVFEPFFRISNKSSDTGSGIGLALAHSLVELHDGVLFLDTSEEVLNNFVLKLPIHQSQEFELYPDSVKIKKKSPEELTSIDNTKSTILLVEDNEDLLDFMAMDLREEYSVIKAKDGNEAFLVLQEETIHLVVTDVMMPGITGFQLCEKIKTNIEFSHIPVIVLTSKSAMDAKIEGLVSGADAYIEKPFSVDYLKMQISNLIGNRKKIIEHFSSSPLAHIRSIAHTKTDEDFLNKLEGIINQQMSNPDLNVDSLAETMNMSRSSLYRKIRSLTELSPNELINVTRLKKAAELLESEEFKVYEVAYKVGYNSITSFGRNFQKQFNMTPSQYLSQQGQ